jgi:hypothetical protein
MALKYYSREWCDEAQWRLSGDQLHLKGLNSLNRICREKPTEE